MRFPIFALVPITGITFSILMLVNLFIGPVYHIEKFNVDGKTKYSLMYCPVIPIIPCDRWGLHDTLEAAQSDYDWVMRPKQHIVDEGRIK